MENKYKFLGRLALFGTAFIWGTSFVVLKNTLDSMGVFWVLALRFTISALLMAAFAGKKLKQMPKPVVKASILMGLCLGVAYIVQTFGLKYTTPGKNAFLTTTYCVLVPFLSWAIYKKKPQLSHVVAGMLCISGIGFVSLSGADGGINIGDVLTLICGIFYALQIIIMDRYLAEGDALGVSVIQFAAGAVLCWVFALIFEKPPTAVPSSAWFSILYLGVMCTGVCFYLQAWGMQYTPATTSAVIMCFEAVFGALTSIIFYHEQITVKLLCGFVLIFFSVVISETNPKFLRLKKEAV